MSHNRLTFTGMDEFKAALRALPVELHAEAGHIVVGHANRAALTVRQTYHEGKTHNLVEGVVVKLLPASPFYAGAIVYSAAKIAAIYERGTKVRQNIRRNGKPLRKPANRGASPKHRVFPDVMPRERDAMNRDLADMMTIHGLKVVVT